MPNLENLATNYTDIYYPSIQKEIVKAIDNGMPMGGVLQAMISINDQAAKTKYGLYSRTKLKSASRFDWNDPRQADGVPIYARTNIGATKVNNKLHNPFDRAIISNNSGYFMGIKPEIKTSSDGFEEVDRELMFTDKLMDMAKAAIGRGSGFLLLSVQSGKVYINTVMDWSAIVLYDQITKQPILGVVYEKDLSSDVSDDPDETDKFNVWVYDGITVTRGSLQSGSFTMTGEPEIHGFNGVPLIEFANNDERIGDVELTTSLQDAYDIANSDLSSEISQLRLAYLVLNTENDFGDDELRQMQQTGALILGQGSAAQFVEKSLNADAVENLKQDLEKSIYKYSNSYNPDEIGKGNTTAFEIQQSLLKMESSAVEREKMFTKAIKYALGLISNFSGLTGSGFGMVESITYTRNVPSNIIEDLKGAREAGFSIAQDILAEKVPFEIDQERNKELLEDQETNSLFVDEALEPVSGDESIDKTDLDVDKDIVLNGAQIKSALDIVRAVKIGEISQREGLNMIEIFFNISEEQARRVLTSG